MYYLTWHEVGQAKYIRTWTIIGHINGRYGSTHRIVNIYTWENKQFQIAIIIKNGTTVTSGIIQIAHRNLSLIFKTSTWLMYGPSWMFLTLFKSLIWPHFEYGKVILNKYLRMTKQPWRRRAIRLVTSRSNAKTCLTVND